MNICYRSILRAHNLNLNNADVHRPIPESASIAGMSKVRPGGQFNMARSLCHKNYYLWPASTVNQSMVLCQKTVAVYKEFNVKRHYQSQHANAYDTPNN